MKEEVIALLEDRGVTVKEMAELVYELQNTYMHLTLDDAIYNIQKVLAKREVQNAILTGIALDQLAEKNLLEEPLLSMIKTDESLYGIDEIIALSITNVYGSIGFTNYGYIDKVKMGLVGKIDKISKTTDKVNTFLDDLVGGIVAAACARLAHAQGDK